MIADFPARRPVAATLLLVLTTAALGASAARVETRYEVEDFFPRHTPERAAFDRARAIFGRDDRTGFVILEAPRPLDVELFREIDALTRRLETWPDLEEVVSPSSARIVVRQPDGKVRLERAIPERGPDEARVALVLDVFSRPPYVGAVLSKDRTVAVTGTVLREDRVGLAERRALRERLRAEVPALERAGFKVRLAGYPIHRLAITDLISSESARLYPLVLIVIGSVLALAVRSAVAAVATLLVAAVSSLWAVGFMGLLGLPPNILAPAVFVMIAVVSVSDSVHIAARVAAARGAGEPVREVLAATLRELAVPGFVTNVTTAIGFTALYLTRLPMIVDFGFQVAIGILAAWFVTVLLVPPLLLAFPGRGSRADGSGRLARWLVELDAAVARRPWAIVLAFALVLGLGALGLARVRVNSPLLSDLAPEHEVRRTNRFIEERLAGVIPLDVLIEPPAGAPSSAAYARVRLDRVGALTARLRRHPDVLSATSVVDTLHELARLLEKVPPEEATGLLPTALLLAHEQVRRWVDERSDVMRIHLTIRDVDTDSAIRIFDEIGRAYREELGEPAEGRLTGQGYLAQVVNARIVEYFSGSFGLGLLGVFAVMLAASRSASLALLSVPPNLFAVVVVGGSMGWLGIDLRYTSALVLTVVFGMSVDNTIHFVEQVRAAALEPGDPIRRAYEKVGPGMVLTGLVLTAGPLVLLLSDFLPSRVMGFLLALNSVVELSADLLLLPASLRLVRRGSAGMPR